MEHAHSLLLACLIVFGFLAVYFAPTIVARHRRHPSATAVFVLNLFLGWTLVVWVLALVWAVNGTSLVAPLTERPTST